MDRFQSVVRFGLTGHTHTEYYQTHNSMTDSTKAVSVNSVGGSATTYGNMNPSFMVLDFDAEYMVPLNMHTYYIDVDEANESGSPDWKELHDYLETYSMADLSPSSFKDLNLRMFTDADLALTFTKNKHR